VDAHVIRAAAGTAFSSQPHRHLTDFQLVYRSSTVSAVFGELTSIPTST